MSWGPTLRFLREPEAQLVHILLDHFILGPDVLVILWKLTIIIASLGICAFLIYLWRTVLAVGPDVRGFPQPTCMPSHMGQTLPGFIGSGLPQPPPPWSTWGPPPHLVPPCGPRFHSEGCGAQGDNSGTAPKKDPEKDKVNTVAVSSCNHFWNPVPVWAAPCPGLVSVGYILGSVCGAVYLLKCQVFMQEPTGFCVSSSSPLGCVGGTKAEFVQRS
ncbi:uncharacterized protein LOC123775570 [Ursus americanus]|uniref:uncharacterized protein LOC123775570 n=1 Tax=Ursus americanus TaxID=9643 RepID=UPI001E67C4AF|nr:uncharacterized protein LOC123775570 [Ursus americanus]XP_045626844.1 uncharacterized protein LOC123775570 [Ursus americanus]